MSTTTGVSTAAKKQQRNSLRSEKLIKKGVFKDHRVRYREGGGDLPRHVLCPLSRYQRPVRTDGGGDRGRHHEFHQRNGRDVVSRRPAADGGILPRADRKGQGILQEPAFKQKRDDGLR